MHFMQALQNAWTRNHSLVCVGLDPEPAKFPAHLKGRPDAVFEFCRDIVDATADLVCTYKPQIAHFAALRAEDALERLIAHIHDKHPGVPVILDAKRGDIGSTAQHYASEAFDRYRADAVTLNPYMGRDSAQPFLERADKGVILLCRTSNPGGSDLQAQTLQNGDKLFEHIARLASGSWNKSGQLALVVGATFPAELARVRELAPTLPLLIPGIGAQGGDIEATVKAGWRVDGPIIVSSSRAILYAGAGDDFAAAARQAALATRAALNAAIAAVR
jgi:orotidine-5'-phosphate decarboxylase